MLTASEPFLPPGVHGLQAVHLFLQCKDGKSTVILLVSVAKKNLYHASLFLHELNEQDDDVLV